MLWVTLLTLLLLLSGALYLNVDQDERHDAVSQSERQVRQKAYEESVGQIVKSAGLAKTEEDWTNIGVLAQKLPTEFEATKMYFGQLATVRIVELKTARREVLLRNAGELLAVNENDPEVKRNIAQAKVLHEEVAKLLKQVKSDPKNPEWNKALSYRKGYEEYRSLAYIEKDENAKALDIIAGAVAHFAKALTAKEKDLRTEYAIEFLYPRAKSEEEKGGKGAGEPGRVRALPSPGRENGPGNGGVDRPRQH